MMTTDYSTCQMDQLSGLDCIAGTQLAIHGEYMAVAGTRNLTVWKGLTKISEIAVQKSIIGTPRITNSHVCWGNVLLDIHSGQFEEIQGIHALMIRGTTAPVNPSPKGSYSPASYSWSPEGEEVVLIARWNGHPGPSIARAILVNKTGQLIKVLWEGNDIDVRTAYFGRNYIILGTRESHIFDREGRLIHVLEADIPATRLELTEDETLLLQLIPGQLKIWDTTTGQLLHTFLGPWMDASISNDGRIILATGFGGKLFCLDPKNVTYHFEQIKIDDLVQDVCIENERFIATFLSGEKIRTGILIIYHE